MIDIGAIAGNVEPGSDGVWRSNCRSEISHPEQYQEWYRAVEDDSYWFRHRAACIVACLRRFPPGGTIIDVGGGNGHVSLAMEQAGFEAVLVEPSPAAVRNARARGLKSIVCSTLADAGFHSESLPAVGMFDVLEHIDDDARLLAELHGLLTPGGRLYVTVPAYEMLWSAHDAAVGHYRRYTLGRLSKRLAAADFAAEFTTYLFSPLPLPILLARSIPYRLWRRPETQSGRAREMGAQQGLAARAMAACLRGEERAVRCGIRIPLGSSCLAVARRR